MSNQPPRYTRAQLEALLDGRSTAADPLAGLVAAARGPAQEHELGGLDAAVAAFAAAPVVAATAEPTAPMLKRVAGRLLALKIVAVAAGTAVAGGVAYAAVSGNLNGASDQSPAVATDSSGAPGSSAAGSSGDGSEESSGRPGSGTATPPSGTGSSGSGSGRARSSSGSSLTGLCTAWLAGPRDVAKVATNPAFRVLIKAAGGPDGVTGYCTTLIATAHPSHPAHHTHPAHPSSLTHPSHPVHPTHPAHPTHAALPVHPTHPVHPSHPVQARNSSHPAHPSHAAHPTRAGNTHTAAPPSLTKTKKPTPAASPSTGRHTRSA